jgi:hypothetical protein
MPSKGKRIQAPPPKHVPSRAVADRKVQPRRSGYFPPEGDVGTRMSWRFGFVDHEGPWSFEEVSAPEFCSVLRKLRDLESMTVSEVFSGSGQPGKDYTISEIPNGAAYLRLEEMGLADMTKMSALRLGGESRLWGFRHDRSIFYIVWWDPRHEIWPSRKKHT